MPGRRVLRPGDVPYVLVAQAGDMLHGEADALPVVDRDRGHRAVLEAAVDEHQRGARRGDIREQLAVKPRGGRDDPVDLSCEHCLEVRVLALGVVVGVDDQRRVPRLVEAVLDPAQDRRKQRVGDVGNQHPDRVRAVCLQSARDRVGPVAKLRGGSQDALGGLLVDQRPRLGVQRARHGAGVHLRHARDVSDRDRGSHPVNYRVTTRVRFHPRAPAGHPTSPPPGLTPSRSASRSRRCARARP